MDVTTNSQGNIKLALLVLVSFSITYILTGNATEQAAAAAAFQTHVQQPAQLTTIQNNENIVKLLADMTKQRLDGAKTILEITSRDPTVKNVSYANNISKTYMGIPESLDIAKRKVAQEILHNNKDFGSIYFTMPNGDVYIGEPYSDQKQLPRLNFADREWYKGVTSANNSNRAYTSSVFISASIHLPATAISVPVYTTGDNDNKNSSDTSNTLLGHWVGIVDLNSVNQSIKNIDLGNNEQIIIVDHNGNALVDFNSSNYGKYNNNINSSSQFPSSLLSTNSTGNSHDHQQQQQQQQHLVSYSNLQSVKKVLSGKNGTDVEVINGIKFLATYHPIEVGNHNWGIVLITKT
jgi:hypothetical protein